jgi:hypothetical protein
MKRPGWSWRSERRTRLGFGWLVGKGGLGVFGCSGLGQVGSHCKYLSCKPPGRYTTVETPASHVPTHLRP